MDEQVKQSLYRKSYKLYVNYKFIV